MTAVWEGRKVVMCVGTGGVGKTTASAAIGLAAAASGLRTLVMTIDPARRLANALGLAEFGNVEREIAADLVTPLGIELRAPLWAMMPDVKRTFDELIVRVAPDRERREKIFQNRFYQQFSTALVGSLEYASVEKLYEVYTSGRYDLVVLDTPPSQNATDFLEAPGKILDFLEQETLQWLLKPYAVAGKLSFKLLDLGNSFVLRTLGKMAGGDTITELAEFILGFQGMYEGFRERSRDVRALLSSEELAFVLVTSTQPNQVAAVQTLREGLHREGMHVRSVVVNRVRRDPFADVRRSALFERIGELVTDPQRRQAIEMAFTEEGMLAELGVTVLDRVKQKVGPTPIIELPELPLDAHDLDSLVALHSAFLPGGGP